VEWLTPVILAIQEVKSIMVQDQPWLKTKTTTTTKNPIRLYLKNNLKQKGLQSTFLLVRGGGGRMFGAKGRGLGRGKGVGG
jgi:hypothetical protein